MFKRLFNFDIESNRSIFLFGPRGTGKTSWLKKHLPNALVLDLLDARLYRQLLAEPERLEDMIPGQFKDWIIIDEVQKVPECLSVVHRLIEAKGYKFVLTGSSARTLKRKGVDLLAGRALTHNMHPLTLVEVGNTFDLKHILEFGLLPDAVNLTDPQHYLDSYITTYLREEVLQEGLTRNLADFSRFLEVASFSQGKILNIAQVAREAAIERKTVESYFNIVEDLLIAKRLPVFSKRAKRKLVGHSKFYFFDVGFYRTIRPVGPLDSVAEAEGPSLETLFLQHLQAYNDYYRLGYTFYYWRTQAQHEIDFIAYGELGLYAFEIKRKRYVDKADLQALELFCDDYPVAKPFVVYGGDRTEYRGRVTLLPVMDALKLLPEILKGSDITSK